MEWAFTLINQDSREPWTVVVVPDGACPPHVGDDVLLGGSVTGSFKVKERIFQPMMPKKGSAGEMLKWGWSFVIEKAQP